MFLAAMRILIMSMEGHFDSGVSWPEVIAGSMDFSVAASDSSAGPTRIFRCHDGGVSSKELEQPKIPY